MSTRGSRSHAAHVNATKQWRLVSFDTTTKSRLSQKYSDPAHTGFKYCLKREFSV